MNEIERSRIEEINHLHAEVETHLKMTVEGAIRIGELLTEQKKSLKHGEFLSWLKLNISFSRRTATRYMKIYKGRDRFKWDTCPISKAYQSLAEHKPLVLPLKVKDILGREFEYNERVRQGIFESDVEWMIYQLPLETPDERIYENMREMFDKREKDCGIPNNFSREVYETIKDAAIREIQYKVEIWEMRVDAAPGAGEGFPLPEHKQKSLKERYAYMMFISMLDLLAKNKPENENKETYWNLALYYRNMYEPLEKVGLS